jgi:hypothetical protein
MMFPRSRRRCAWLSALVLMLAAGAARADGPSFEAPVAPIRTPLQLEYRPLKGSFLYGSVLVERKGDASAHPKRRVSGALRVERVRDQLAVTFDIDAAAGKTDRKGSGARMIRLLMTPKGELLDAVMADENGKTDSRDNRMLLAQFAQELFLLFPRFPDRAVVSGDKLFDYEWDLGRMMGAPPGTFPVRITGTVRGKATVEGRSVLVVDYETKGRCSCEKASFLEQGYELIDLSTGIVSASAGHARMEGDKGFSTWSSGAAITFQ